MKNSLLVIALIFLIFNISCKKNPTSSKNTAPVASFTITPSYGTVATVFSFDAIVCTDNEDSTSTLEVRWDWENDGTWDTDYSTAKTATHQYGTVGTYTVKLEVVDKEGLTNTTTKEVIVSIQYTGTVTDIDGNVYQTVQIGNQVWMAENLKVTQYRDGTKIPNVTDNTQWSNLSIAGAYCSIDNDDNNIDTYGLMYNWFAVNDARGLAPTGWHIPTEDEWKTLEMYLGMSQVEADATRRFRGTDEGGKLKEIGTAHWQSPNTGATNESGFTALPGGYRYYLDGTFKWLGQYADFWSSTESFSTRAWGHELGYDNSGVERSDWDRKSNGFSVRCVRD